jgi:dephospho-CoA kinase
MIIGITGRSGSGKSYVSKLIANQLDMIHIDIDKISHEVLSFDDTIEFIKAEFGECVFDNNQINRKKLGNVVFNNTEKLGKLNKFCQLQIEKKLDEIISSTKKSIILDYALLCWLKQFNLCDVKILLNTDIDIRFERVSKRENITREYFNARENSLEALTQFKFDYIFDNISDEQIKKLITDLQKRSNHD